MAISRPSSCGTGRQSIWATSWPSSRSNSLIVGLCTTLKFFNFFSFDHTHSCYLSETK